MDLGQRARRARWLGRFGQNRCVVMRIAPALKRLIPGRLRPPLRKCWRVLRGTPLDGSRIDSDPATVESVDALEVPPISPYCSRVQGELETFEGVNVQDVPPIMHYWANTHVVPMVAPFGFTDALQCFRTYIARVCQRNPNGTASLLSVGAGTCTSEITIAGWLREDSIENFVFECADINPTLLDQGRALAEEKQLSSHFRFAAFDVNSWQPDQQYHVVLALQALHHFVELEVLFDKIHRALRPDGYFLTDDMIGRNGHQRWPEALTFVNELWRQLPEKYRYNHSLKRYEEAYENWDCSTVGFEGIRSQDILPLLIERFSFDYFFAFGNVIDIFVDRSFGPNFSPDNEWDRAFIDRVHALDVREIEAGRVKPTHMMAAMTKGPVERPRIYKHLSPGFCVRRPEAGPPRAGGRDAVAPPRLGPSTA